MEQVDARCPQALKSPAEDEVSKSHAHLQDAHLRIGRGPIFSYLDAHRPLPDLSKGVVSQLSTRVGPGYSRCSRLRRGVCGSGGWVQKLLSHG